MNKRTALSFNVQPNTEEVIEKWAASNNFKIRQRNDTEILYEKETGGFTAPMMLKITRIDNEVHIEAWIRIIFIIRLCSFFILPSEMGIESGGFRAIIPRQIARTAINELLAQLGQNPIN